jgi:hypothetical protein
MPFEVAQLAVQLLPYTSDQTNDVTVENKVVSVPASFHDRAKEAIEMVHTLYGYACLHEHDELERRGNPYWPLDSKEERDALDQETDELRDIAERFEKLANGRPEIEAKEFMALILPQRRKPSVSRFINSWSVFESTRGKKLPFSSETAWSIGIEFPQWYKENYTKVSDKLRKGWAARGGKKKHSNANKKHGEAPLSRGIGKKIDKASNGLSQKRSP